MYETSYNNIYTFLPYINSTKNNNSQSQIANKRKFNLSQQNPSLGKNKLQFNGIENKNKIQIFKITNSFRNNHFYIKNRNPYFNFNNFDSSKTNKNFTSSIFNLNNSSEKTNLPYLNKNNSNLSLENNINNSSSKNTLILNLNRTDSFKNYSSSVLFKNLLKKIASEPKKETKIKAYKNTVNKLSNFYTKSKDEKITAKQIYKHYLKVEIKKPKNKRHQFSGSYDYSYVICPRLKILYGDNTFYSRVNELKKNIHIAKKRDFNICEYQRILMKLFQKTISEENMAKLKDDYKKFNEKNFGVVLPKGRYIDLALRLKDHLSVDAFENIKRLDRNYQRFYCQNNNKKDDDKNQKNKKIKKKKQFLIKKLKIKEEENK